MEITQYSKIIGPKRYTEIINNQHLYINEADEIIKKIVEKEKKNEIVEIVEIGCGPARLTKKFENIKNIKVTGIDIDESFLEYAKTIDKNTNFLKSDIISYIHSKKVDIFVSQGVHHHIDKGKKTTKYLQNISNQLKKNGIYILSDEFLPDYNSEKERNINSIIWYSHIIASALKKKFTYLAEEEAKTLLDDLFIKTKQNKNKQHIKLILDNSKKINKEVNFNNIEKAKDIAILLFDEIKKNSKESIDKNLLMSRGDFKICEKNLKKELTNVSLEISKKIEIGPKQKIGSMSIYIIKNK